MVRNFSDAMWEFGKKQASASLFGALLLIAILLSEYFYPDIALQRFDFLFLFAIFVQILLIAFKLEEPKEVLVILIFHMVATAMELFKTSGPIGSWSYPGVEDTIFKVQNVPLFAGFMYSAVGSYIARVLRIFDMKFTDFPPAHYTWILAVLIYANFFSHHFIVDIRYPLIAAIVIMFWRTRIYFKVRNNYRSMPILLSQFFTAIFIWVAENISTFGTIWLYPSQHNGWQLVPLSKMSAWFMLLMISFVLVTLVHKPKKLIQHDVH